MSNTCRAIMSGCFTEVVEKREVGVFMMFEVLLPDFLHFKLV